MRTIKFRGKRVDNGEWVYGNLMIESSGDFCIYNLLKIPNLAEGVIPETVGQFTGLTDKNGKDIYEGDIVKYYQPYSKTWHVHVVLWDTLWACFGLFEKENKWCLESDWVKIKNIEVIGNIHSNPELLNQ